MSEANGTSNGAAEHDPKTAVRLSTIQGVGLHVEQSIEAVKNEMHVRKGIIAGLVAAQRQLVPKVMAEIQRRIDLPETDEKHLDGDAMKVTLHWLGEAIRECADAVLLNQKELVKQEGIVEGMTKAVDACEFLHKQEQQKALRRANEEERGNRDGGRPVPLKERFGASAAEAKAAATGDGEIVGEEAPARPKKGARKKTRAN